MLRNFPPRSGTKEDSVYVCSPETAPAAALTGQVTDPRDLQEKLGIDYPHLEFGASRPDDSSAPSAVLSAIQMRPERC